MAETNGESEIGKDNNVIEHQNNYIIYQFIPRGGPLYVANLVSSLTKPPMFHSHLISELRDIREELGQDFSDIDENDLSVDELKIGFNDIAFNDDQVSKQCSQEELVDKVAVYDDQVPKQFFEKESVDKAFDIDDQVPKQFSEKESVDKVDDQVPKQFSEEELVDKAFDMDDQVPKQCPREELVDKVAVYDDQVSKQFREEELVDKAFDNEKTDSGKLWELGNNGIPESSKRGIKGKLSDVGKKKKGKRLKCRNNDKKRRRKRDAGDKRRKRKRRKEETVEESYMAKVKQLVRIKERQIEDKAAARLHSFNGINDNATMSSERAGRTMSLKGNNSTGKARISSSQEGQVVEPGKEVVLCVEVYHNQRTWQKTQEFLVLGRQSLSELRDKIYCLTDQMMERAGHHDTSGYFLVEDVFYNDLRDASAIDYSKPILDWLEDSKKEAHEKWEYIVSGKLQPKQKALVDDKKKENLPRFKAFQMHEMRFCDLNFRLGAEYQYCHQGDCKHTIVIRDMRLIHPEDVQDRCSYPVVTFQFKPRIRKCSVCQIFRAKLVTVDDKWAGENPCYFCDTCYYMLHYANESLLYPDFSVYDYQHDQI